MHIILVSGRLGGSKSLTLTGRHLIAGVLLMSEDLGQLFALSDRLIVLYRGKIIADCRPQETSPTEIGYAMTGANGAPFANPAPLANGAPFANPASISEVPHGG